jgi:hypothetical protein
MVRGAGLLTLLGLVGFWLIVARRGRRQAVEPVAG